MKYAYQRNGAPLLSWKRAAPQQSRAADAKSLGSLGGDTLDAMPLPVPGGPEPIGGLGCGTCGGGVGGITDTIAGLPTAVKVACVIGAFFLYKKMKKRR